VGLILDSSLLIADEREGFDLPAWLHGRRPEPVAVSVITFSELWFGIEVEAGAARARAAAADGRRGFSGASKSSPWTCVWPAFTREFGRNSRLPA
jgi:hypothetical protein